MPIVRRGNLPIHYTVQGSGRPLLLNHSFLCSGAMWAPQLAQLSQLCRVVNIDARGHGQSGPIDADFTLYDMVDDTLAVLDALGLQRAIWAGLSIGGMVALRAALTAPERVDALLLLDTDAGAERPWPRLKYAAMALAARTIGIRPLLGQVARQMFGATTRRRRAELVAEWRTHFAAVHLPSVLSMLRALVERDDLGGRLARIDVPALVVVGSEDRSLPPARSRALARGLSGSRLVEIGAAGHLSTLEQPEQVTAAMLEFIRGL